MSVLNDRCTRREMIYHDREENCNEGKRIKHKLFDACQLKKERVNLRTHQIKRTHP